MTQTAKHTPGPWRILPAVSPQHSPSIRGADDTGIATIWRHAGGNINLPAGANARLIAAAPETAAERDRLKALNAELLAALKLIRRMAYGLIDGEKTAAEVLAKCGAEAGVALDKAEER